MQSMVYDALSRVSQKTNEMFLVHNLIDGSTHKYKMGQSQPCPLPDSLAQHVKNESKMIEYFKQAGNIGAIYFLRINMDNTKLVVILNDTKSGESINCYLNAFLKELTDVQPAINTPSNNDAAELDKLVGILKKSRDKYAALIDGLITPMYTVDSSYKILHGNLAVMRFVGAEKMDEVVGKQCYKLIFDLDEPCAWCKLEHVKLTGMPSKTDANKVVRNKTRYYDAEIFMLKSNKNDGEEFGEIIYDKTEKVEMTFSMSKFREQIQSYKREKVSDMVESNDIKKAYEMLLTDYDAVVSKNKKLMAAMETLMDQSLTKDFIAIKSELHEEKNKNGRLESAIKNYQRNLLEMQDKYTELNKRAFFQIERVINILNSKMAGQHEFHTAIEFLETEFFKVKEELLKDKKTQ